VPPCLIARLREDDGAMDASGPSGDRAVAHLACGGVTTTRARVSTYEDYTSTSAHYDSTRWALGVEIVLGCVADAATPLAEVVLLDAGCGTGNYAAAVLPHVARIEAIDASEAMLEVAGDKLSAQRDDGRIGFSRASVDQLPFDDASVDAVMISQVLHHLGDSRDGGWQRHGRVIGELVRVLRPGGTLVVNTCSEAQLRDGFWYYSLIPRAAAALRRRYAPLAVLEGFMVDHGLRPIGRFVPVDGVVQGEAYFDVRGPLRTDWRSGDSTWALTDADELAAARAELIALDERGQLAEDVARRGARRPDVGQMTFLAARRSSE
jgi:ubiquinone/menaquinone biosynthesis C-methylase UbiE